MRIVHCFPLLLIASIASAIGASAQPHPMIIATPSLIDCGTVTIGDSKEGTAQLMGINGSPTVTASLDANRNFILENPQDPVTLSGTMTARVLFRPVDVGQQFTELHITCGSDCQGTIVGVSGNALKAASDVPTAERTASTELALGWSYPNPATATIALPYTLDAPDRILLVIVDDAGRVVERVKEGPEDAGSKIVFFDASRLGSGSYRWQLYARDRVLGAPFRILR